MINSRCSIFIKEFPGSISWNVFKILHMPHLRKTWLFVSTARESLENSRTLFTTAIIIFCLHLLYKPLVDQKVVPDVGTWNDLGKHHPSSVPRTGRPICQIRHPHVEREWPCKECYSSQAGKIWSLCYISLTCEPRQTLNPLIAILSFGCVPYQSIPFYYLQLHKLLHKLLEFA